MAGNNQNKSTKRQGERVVPSLSRSGSRVSKAAGGQDVVQSIHVEQRSNLPAPRQSSRTPAASRATPRAKPDAGAARKSPAPRTRRPAPTAVAPPFPGNPRDTQFIQWAGDKWSSLQPHHRQRVFSSALLALSLLLFASLTIFQSSAPFSGIGQFFLTCFGWSAYLLALGLVAFALVHLIEGMRNQRYLRLSMVGGMTVIWLLLLVESRLIVGPHVGVLAELLVLPLLGWSPAVSHVMVLGLLLIAVIMTFRITFGHILLVVRILQGLFADTEPTLASNKPAAPSPYLGQRPQYSRYAAGRPAPAEPAPKVPLPTRSGRKPLPADVEDDDEGDIDFEADFDIDDEDPLNDIALHKQEVGQVPHGPRGAKPLDPAEHTRAVQGVKQQPLAFDPAEAEEAALILRPTLEMEPLPMKAPPPAANAPAKGRASAKVPAAINNVIVSSWKVPSTTLLNNPDTTKLQLHGDDTASLAKVIQDTLRSFRVEAEVRPEDISIGPTIIRFGIRPTGRPEMRKDEKTGKMVPVVDAAGQLVYETRTRVSRIMALQNDLALVLEAKTIRMEAPVPGRPYVGVEIPNKNSRLVTLREILESKEYQAAKAKSKLAIGLGKDVAGVVRVSDLARMPHLLIAGATGAGKCLASHEPVFLADGRVVKVESLVGQTVEVLGLTDMQTMQQIPVPATFTDNGSQDVYVIQLDNGQFIQRTGEHPLWAARLNENQRVGWQPDGKAMRRTRAVNAGWVPAKDLRVCGNRPNFDGHVILCPQKLQQKGTVVKSDADVILCAALIAEGSLNRYEYLTYMRTPRFTNADPLMVELVTEAAKEYDCQLVLSQTTSKGPFDYYISKTTRKGRGSGNPIAQLVRDWQIDCLATEKVIPAWVFELPDEQVALFLRVFIDCDGWFCGRSEGTVSVNVTLANPVLIQQIGQLAFRLGIVGTYTFKENGFAGAWTWSSPRVDLWQERVGSLVKAEKLARAVAELQKNRENAAKEWTAWRTARPLPDQTFADCPPGYEWRKIISIHQVTCSTVNIEVHSENHAFVGYAVEHNSVCINTIIASVLTQATPDDVRMLMVDPKMVELNMYNGIPHLLSPVVIEVDKVVSLLKNAIAEMERRYRLFSQLGVRNLDGYRKLRLENMAKGDTSLNNLPAIVIIIDELADLMMAAPEEVEGMICRLAQLARATGIHLIIATQRPSVDVITGLIKANIPTRISFMVSSAVDSRTIIDMGGAERLLGRGDMLYLPADAGRPERIQCAFLTDEEAQTLAEYWRAQIAEHDALVGANPAQASARPQVEPGWELKEEPIEEDELDDDLLEKAEEVVREYGRASISLLQRRLRIGYSRAARLIDLLEQHGIIGQSDANGRGAREVYDNGNAGYDRRHHGSDGQSLADVADDIMAEEKARNDFLRNQAARLHQHEQKNQNGPENT